VERKAENTRNDNQISFVENVEQTSFQVCESTFTVTPD